MSIKQLFDKSDECCRRDFMAGAASGLLSVGALPVLGGFASAQDKQKKGGSNTDPQLDVTRPGKHGKPGQAS